MTALPPLPGSFVDTRAELQRVATHVVARARVAAVDRISLRVTPGGFGTPQWGSDVAQVRVSGGHLVREFDTEEASTVAAIALDGSTMAELAEFVGVDLGADLDVGADAPVLGDVATPLDVDGVAAAALAAWFAAGAASLDRVVGALPASATPTAVRLWPEHFDVAIDVAATPDLRVNLGASPGDGFHGEPYAYVGPWTDDRPGDPVFWNAPFGAILGYDRVAAADDPVATLAGFFLAGMSLLVE